MFVLSQYHFSYCSHAFFAHACLSHRPLPRKAVCSRAHVILLCFGKLFELRKDNNSEVDAEDSVAEEPAAAEAVPADVDAAAGAIGGVWAAAAGVGAVGNELAVLVNRKRALAAEQAAINRDLRNAEKRRARLCERARGLSDADLIAILGTHHFISVCFRTLSRDSALYEFRTAFVTHAQLFFVQDPCVSACSFPLFFHCSGTRAAAKANPKAKAKAKADAKGKGKAVAKAKA